MVIEEDPADTLIISGLQILAGDKPAVALLANLWKYCLSNLSKAFDGIAAVAHEITLYSYFRFDRKLSQGVTSPTQSCDKEILYAALADPTAKPTAV